MNKGFWVSLVAALAMPAVALATAANPANVQNSPANQTEAHGSAYFDGGATINGTIAANALGKPAVGSVTNSGTAGSTTYTYYCVAQDVNGNETIPSNSFTTTTGNATLSATNFNTITCGGTRGAVSYRVLKADTSHSLGTCSASYMGGNCNVVDNTTGAGSAYTALGTDGTGFVNSTRKFHYNSTNAVVSNAVANYWALDGTMAGAAAAAIGDAEQYAGQISTFRNLYCELTTAGGVVTVAGGTNYVIALDDVTQSATTLTCTIGAAASSCSDTTHSYTTTAGDLIAMIDTPSGTPTALIPKCQVEEDF